MRLLPCRSKDCNGRPAMLPPTALHPDGEPHVAGRYQRTVKCARCKRTTHLSAADFAGLAVLTVADFERLAREHRAPALAALPTQDLVGAGFTREQAAYLYDRAGIRGSAEVEAFAEDMKA